MLPTLQIRPDQFDQLRAHLSEQGFQFEQRPHQAFLARKLGVILSLYENGKIVINGSNSVSIQELRAYILSLGAQQLEKTEKQLTSLDILYPHVGTDEVGKGDYFGPLVIGGVLATTETAVQLQEVGVIDSKKLSDTTIANKASQIRLICGQKHCTLVTISPLKYNILIHEMRNLNRLLGWGHARAIENLLANGTMCKTAVADQFGDPGYIRDALMARGKEVELIQTPKAERDIAVAAASILARDSFLKKREDLGKAYRLDFPKGSSNVIDFGKRLVQEHGMEVLANVAKIHFATTKDITGGIIPEIPLNVIEQVGDERARPLSHESERQDDRLECYNLISTFEGELRSFMKTCLSREFGPGWWEKCVQKDVRAKAEKLAESEGKKGRATDPVDCLDFSHYEWILIEDENWEKAFRKIFGNKDYIRARLIVLKSYRDPVAHTRGEITPKEKGEVIGSIHWIRKMMRAQKSLPDSIPKC